MKISDQSPLDWIVILLVVFVGCVCFFGPNLGQTRDKALQEKRRRETTASEEKEKSLSFEQQLLQIASEYRKYGIYPGIKLTVDGCGPSRPSTHLSKAGMTSLHAKKLYHLFVKHEQNYKLAGTRTSPVGQIVVKESWAANEVDANQWWHFQNEQGRWRRGEQKELFIMWKVNPETLNTDGGWVYGVASADAKTVVEVGMLKNCMSCHEAVGVDRLFGPEVE